MQLKLSLNSHSNLPASAARVLKLKALANIPKASGYCKFIIKKKKKKTETNLALPAPVVVYLYIPMISGAWRKKII